MRKELDVWILGERVGSLSQGDAGALSFRYLRDYRGVPCRPAYPCLHVRIATSPCFRIFGAFCPKTLRCADMWRQKRERLRTIPLAVGRPSHSLPSGSSKPASPRQRFMTLPLSDAVPVPGSPVLPDCLAGAAEKSHSSAAFKALMSPSCALPAMSACPSSS